MSDFSRLLKRIRKENNLKQFELAKKLEVLPSTISSYETGRIEPSQKVIDKLMEEFNLSYVDVYGAKDSNTIKTYKQLFESLLSIFATTPVIVDETSKYSKDGIKRKILVFTDNYIDDFIDKIDNMRKLLVNKSITQDVFNTWIYSELEKYKDEIIGHHELKELDALREIINVFDKKEQ